MKKIAHVIFTGLMTLILMSLGIWYATRNTTQEYEKGDEITQSINTQIKEIPVFTETLPPQTFPNG